MSNKRKQGINETVATDTSMNEVKTNIKTSQKEAGTGSKQSIDADGFNDTSPTEGVKSDAEPKIDGVAQGGTTNQDRS